MLVRTGGSEKNHGDKAMFEVTLIGAAIAGLLSFLSPCVLPLAPPYLCYIGGVSMNQMTEGEGPSPAVRRSIIFASIAFALGLATIFVALGATFSAIGQWVGENRTMLSRIAGVVIIVMGLHFIGVFRIALLYREARLEVNNKPPGLLGAYVVGLAFGFGWTPCVGPALGAVLMAAANEPSAWGGATILLAYGLGMGLPFVLIAVFMVPFMRWMGGFRKHLRKVEIVMGIFLILVGILFVTNTMRDVGFWMLEVMPWLSTFT